MGHTEVVNLVRAAPRVVDLVVGRVLEAPKPRIEAHLLPDICFKDSQKPLGKKITQHPPPQYFPGVAFSTVLHRTLVDSSCSVARSGAGRRQRQHLRHPVCQRHLARHDGLRGGQPQATGSHPLHQRRTHPGADLQREHQAAGVGGGRPLSQGNQVVTGNAVKIWRRTSPHFAC